MKKMFSLMLSIMVALTSIVTLNADLVVNAEAITYPYLLKPDTTALTEDDFTLTADNSNAEDGGVTTMAVSSTDAGVTLSATPNIAYNGLAYFTLNEGFTPDFNSKTVIRFNVVESNKRVEYKLFLEDSDGNPYNINSYITDNATINVDGGDEIILEIDWSGSSSKVYRNGTEIDSLKEIPSKEALSRGIKLGFAIAASTKDVARAITVSDLVVEVATTYKSLLTPDTTRLAESDFTLDADKNKDDTTFTVSSSAAGVLLEVTAPSTDTCGNAYYILNESFTPDYNSTTVIRFNAVETNKYTQYKPFLQDSDGTRYHITSFVTDGSTASVAGGDEIVLMIDWSGSTSQVYRNGETLFTLKTFPTQTALSGGIKLGFALSSDKATATRSFTVSDLKIWETSEDALSCTVESTEEGTAQVKFNMPLFKDPDITIDNAAVTVTKVDDVTYTIDTSELTAGDYTVTVTANSVASLEAHETTITVSGFDPNAKGVAKLSYSNGTLYLTKKPGATISARIIKAVYNNDDTFVSSEVLAENVTASTSVSTTNAAGKKTKYFVWSDDGNMKPLGEPLEY